MNILGIGGYSHDSAAALRSVGPESNIEKKVMRIEALYEELNFDQWTTRT